MVLSEGLTPQRGLKPWRGQERPCLGVLLTSGNSLIVVQWTQGKASGTEKTISAKELKLNSAKWVDPLLVVNKNNQEAVMQQTLHESTGLF